MEKQNKLIIFDCDGVLVDSEPLSCQIVAGQLQEMDIQMTTEDAMDLFSGGSLSNIRDYVRKLKERELPENFEEVYRKRSYELFEQSLEIVTGIKEVLESLNYSKCVGSNGPLHKIRFNLSLTGLGDFFKEETLFSAYEIERWKPDPTLYLHAAKTMGFEPKDCVVVEDSNHGVQAAIAAGMQVFGYTGRTARAKLESAGAEVFDDMRDLLKLIG